jgi:hypothetical protein
MHALAAEDPVFLAMNARAQRETKGAVGVFCVGCHAPLAVRMGLTKDGLNLSSLPPEVKGITCYFCHTALSANGVNDNPITLADDSTMRGGIRDPIAARPHRAQYSAQHDQTSIGSSAICGSCHDVLNTHGAEIETTFAEWRRSAFANLAGAVDNTRSCGSCHMPASDGYAASIPHAPGRRIHDHSMAGVDVDLRSTSGQEDQTSLVQQQLDGAVSLRLCVNGPPGAGVQVTLQSDGVGHRWPSGAIQDRRAWVELVAMAGDRTVFATGVVAPGQPVTSLVDPNLWIIRELIFDDQKKEVPFFWQAFTVGAPMSLPAPSTSDGPDAGDAHSVTRSFDVPASADQITARVRIVPIGEDLLDELVRGGDLDPSIRARMPVFTLAKTNVTWKRGAPPCIP